MFPQHQQNLYFSNQSANNYGCTTPNFSNQNILSPLMQHQQVLNQNQFHHISLNTQMNQFMIDNQQIKMQNYVVPNQFQHHQQHNKVFITPNQWMQHYQPFQNCNSTQSQYRSQPQQITNQYNEQLKVQNQAISNDPNFANQLQQESYQSRQIFPMVDQPNNYCNLVLKQGQGFNNPNFTVYNTKNFVDDIANISYDCSTGSKYTGSVNQFSSTDQNLKNVDQQGENQNLNQQQITHCISLNQTTEIDLAGIKENNKKQKGYQKTNSNSVKKIQQNINKQEIDQQQKISTDTGKTAVFYQSTAKIEEKSLFDQEINQQQILHTLPEENSTFSNSQNEQPLNSKDKKKDESRIKPNVPKKQMTRQYSEAYIIMKNIPKNYISAITNYLENFDREILLEILSIYDITEQEFRYFYKRRLKTPKILNLITCLGGNPKSMQQKTTPKVISLGQVMRILVYKFLTEEGQTYFFNNKRLKFKQEFRSVRRIFIELCKNPTEFIGKKIEPILYKDHCNL